MASFQNTGERIIFSFASLYADIRGASPAQVGIMLSLQNILAFIGQQYFGKASDRVGRAKIIGLGWIISIISSFLILNFLNPVLIIATFAFYNIGFSMVQPAWNALIGDTYSGEDRATKLGIIGSFATFFGGMIYLATGLVSEMFARPFAFIFLISGICFVCALIIVIVLHFSNRLPEIERKPVVEKQRILDPLRKHPKFRRFVFIDTTFALAMSLSWPLFPRATNNLANPAQVSIIWFATFLGFSITARYTHRLRTWVGSYHRSLFYSRMLMFGVPLTFAFATSWLHIVAIRSIAGASFGFYSILQKDYILETCDHLDRGQDRGWFLGSHSLVWGVLTFFGSLFAGYVTEYFVVVIDGDIGYSELFIVAAIIRVFAVFLFLKVPELD
jgi:MFS family permease